MYAMSIPLVSGSLTDIDFSLSIEGLGPTSLPHANWGSLVMQNLKQPSPENVSVESNPAT